MRRCRLDKSVCGSADKNDRAPTAPSGRFGSGTSTYQASPRVNPSQFRPVESFVAGNKGVAFLGSVKYVAIVPLSTPIPIIGMVTGCVKTSCSFA